MHSDDTTVGEYLQSLQVDLIGRAFAECGAREFTALHKRDRKEEFTQGTQKAR